MQIHTTAIGDITVHSIEDGHFLRDPTVMFPTSDPAVWSEGWPAYGDGRLRISLGCFLLETPDGHVLVDSGIGTHADIVGGAGGDLPLALDQLEVAPSEIATVVHTHLHPDHISGNVTPEGALAFPEATFSVHEAELAFWQETDHPTGEVVRSIFGPVVDAGRHRTVTAETPITTRVSVIETPGHTPGHVSVVVDGGNGSKLVITGDVTHHPAQARHPEWHAAADLDQPQATETRRRVFAMLADEGWVQASGHYPRPGFGRVSRSGDAFVMALERAGA